MLHGNRDEPMRHEDSIPQMKASRKYPSRIIAIICGAGNTIWESNDYIRARMDAGRMTKGATKDGMEDAHRGYRPRLESFGLGVEHRGAQSCTARVKFLGVGLVFMLHKLHKQTL